jgi:hypothetical protein
MKGVTRAEYQRLCSLASWENDQTSFWPDDCEAKMHDHLIEQGRAGFRLYGYLDVDGCDGAWFITPQGLLAIKLFEALGEALCASTC